jgi:hypothetical protein
MKSAQVLERSFSALCIDEILKSNAELIGVGWAPFSNQIRRSMLEICILVYVYDLMRAFGEIYRGLCLR